MKYMLPLAVLLLAGCKKEDCECPKPADPAACDAGNYGLLTIGNSDSNDAYDIYIDGAFIATIGAGGTLQNIQVQEGDVRHIEAIDADQDIFSSDYEVYSAIIECHDYSWNFP